MLYLGKRNPGSLTAASPGDTLIFPFGTYNDSGASIGIGGTLAVSDIEVLKDGAATVRATDSGYSLISDTGQVGDRVGLHRVRIQLFNTADDPTFYAVGSSYQAFVDSITVDGRTVRFWLGTWEIGEPRANVVAFNDTGINDRLAKIQADVDTGLRNVIADLDTGLRDTLADYDTGIRALFALRDTGAIAAAVWSKDARTLTGWSSDTGVQQKLDRYDTGVRSAIAQLSNKADTGVPASVWESASRTLTAFAFDTGVWSSNFAAGRTLTSLDVDTGLRALIADLDTGLRDHIIDYATDTGLRDFIGDIDTGLRDAIDNVDTGVTTRLGAFTFTVAGMVDANIQYVNDVQVGGVGDTGIGSPWGPA